MKKAFYILSLIFIWVAAVMAPADTYALAPDHYAANSRLAQGKWSRIKVTTAGMHLISNSELSKLGFNDPSKVRVYGMGGAPAGEGFTYETPDDLPMQPSVRTDKGIVFYAADHFSWRATTNTARPYEHKIHGYSNDSYYFISDVESEELYRPAMRTQCDRLAGDRITDFIARDLHEVELEPAGVSGSQIYGEDFRSNRSQTFSFKFPDRVKDTDGAVYVRFAAKTTNGTSSIRLKANGEYLPSTESDRIASTKSDGYASVTETSKIFSTPGESFDLAIEYSPTGTLFKARLDYIEAFYQRKLALLDGQLHFYGYFDDGDIFSIAGCSQSTIIWDVTNPAAVETVRYALSGDKAEFGQLGDGYREYIVFNPSSVSKAATGDGAVANQDIHGLETPDMVIITFPLYREGAEKLARFHEETDGFRVHVLNAADIYNEFTGGKTDPTAFRRLLKMWHDRGESADGHRIRYCLLMGKPSFDHKLLTPDIKNAGYTPMPIYQSYNGLSEEVSYSCDDYIAMLDDVNESSFNISTAKLSVAVGRLPVTTSQQAVQMADKIIRYATESELGIWRNKVMLIADDDDNGVHLDQTETAWKESQSSGNGKSFVYDKLYLDSYKRVLTSIGATYPQATERMMRNYNDGVLLTCYVGHASETGWGHEHLWEWPSITSMTNRNLTFMYGATCSFLFWDKAVACGGEELMLNPNAGVVGMIAASRKVYVDKNGQLSKTMLPAFFRYDENGEALRFGDAYLHTRNVHNVSNSLRYALMGDPALKIPNPGKKVSITSINGQSPDVNDYILPELAANSLAVIEGEILNGDETVDTGFNGNICLQLYDGERIITTYGQGESGRVISYNDRDKRLAMTTAKVKDGRWTASLRVPPEILGNYTRAMIAGYAWSDARVEANGINTNLYVYGFDDESEADSEGPVIEYFYVNTPNFQSGDVVNSNPVVMARMKDESGINISDSSIGHSLTLTLDDKELFTDLSSYFSLDTDSDNTGTLVYPLSGVKTGRHTLTLSVWDNANNVTKSTIDINVGAAVDPVIYGITASVNPASVDFRIDLDRPNTSLQCAIGIYDLNGRRLWSVEDTFNTDTTSSINTSWNMCDSSGTRVERGIYIYRVTVETPEGTYSSKSKKIAISAAQ